MLAFQVGGTVGGGGAMDAAQRASGCRRWVGCGAGDGIGEWGWGWQVGVWMVSEDGVA